MAHIQKVIENGFDDFDTLQWIKKSETRNVHVLSRLISIEGREIHHGIRHDITADLSRSKKALQKSERTLHEALDATPFLEIARQSNLPVNTGEYEVTCHDGAVVICELYATFIADNLIVAFNDITQRKRSEAMQRKMQSRTEAILAGISDTFYSLDDQWRLAMVNPAAEKVSFGRPAVELIGNVIWDLYPNLVGTDIHGHAHQTAEKHALEHDVAQSPLHAHGYEVFMQGWLGGVELSIPVIICTGCSERGSPEKAESFGVKGFLMKPVIKSEMA